MLNNFMVRGQPNNSPLQLNLLPISELHVHADGGVLTSALIHKLAKKHGMPIRAGLLDEKGVVTHKTGDFLDFLKVYDEITQYIRDEEDLSEVIYDYLRRCSEEGAIYVELTSSPDHFKHIRTTYTDISNHLSNKDKEKEKDTVKVQEAVQADSAPQKANGLAYFNVVRALAVGIDKARKEFGIEARIVMVLLRHNGAKGCEPVLEDIIKYRHPYVVGINLAGDEINFPSELFVDLYARAKEAGLKRTAHVGEQAPASEMTKAIELLHLDRIGHGVTCEKDKILMDKLRDSGIGLEICPTSNVDFCNGIYKSYQAHPLKQIFEHGIKCSLSTDDPAFLDISLGREYSLVQKEYHFSDDQMYQFCVNSIEMSFTELTLKEKLLAHIKLSFAVTMFREACKAKGAPDMGTLLDQYANCPEISKLFLMEKHMEKQVEKLPFSDQQKFLMPIRHLLLLHREYSTKCELHEQYTRAAFHEQYLCALLRISSGTKSTQFSSTYVPSLRFATNQTNNKRKDVEATAENKEEKQKVS